MVSLTSFITLLATAAAAAHAAPVMEPQVELAVGRDGLSIMEERWQAQAQTKLTEREVINCEITSPTADSVWTAGEEVKVTWDPACVSDDKFKDFTGTILLGYKDLLSPGSNLNVDAPLAQDFALKAGSECECRRVRKIM